MDSLEIGGLSRTLGTGFNGRTNRVKWNFRFPHDNLTGSPPTRKIAQMMKLRWLALPLGILGYVCTASLAAPVWADQTGDDSAETEGLELDTQLAQTRRGTGGVTGYEVPRRRGDVGRGQTVIDRPRPELDPLGATMGSFLVLPSITVEQLYNDNIFADDGDEEDDFITQVIPRLEIRSDWNNHELNFQSGAAIGRYWDNDSEDYEDYYAGVSGRLDIRRSTQLRVRSRYARLHEDRGSSDDAGGEDPTELDAYTLGAALRHDFGRINGTVGGEFRRLSFDDVDAPGGDIPEHNRDRNRVEGIVRVGYEIQPQYEVFVRGSYNDIDYDGLNGAGIDRSSDGYGVAVGLEVDFGGIVFGDFFAGYRSQDYDDSSLDDIDGFGGGADITWNVTKLTTVEFSALGDIQQTTVTDASGTPASGRLVATGEVTVDHELRRNLLLAANASVTRDDFEGISRTDYVYRAGFGVTYMLNRYLYLGADYDFRKKDADAGGTDFIENIALIRLQVQY